MPREYSYQQTRYKTLSECFGAVPPSGMLWLLWRLPSTLPFNCAHLRAFGDMWLLWLCMLIQFRAALNWVPLKLTVTTIELNVSPPIVLIWVWEKGILALTETGYVGLWTQLPGQGKNSLIAHLQVERNVFFSCINNLKWFLNSVPECNSTQWTEQKDVVDIWPLASGRIFCYCEEDELNLHDIICSQLHSSVTVQFEKTWSRQINESQREMRDVCINVFISTDERICSWGWCRTACNLITLIAGHSVWLQSTPEL